MEIWPGGFQKVGKLLLQSLPELCKTLCKPTCAESCFYIDLWRTNKKKKALTNKPDKAKQEPLLPRTVNNSPRQRRERIQIKARQQLGKIN